MATENDKIWQRIDKIRQFFCGGYNIEFAAKIGKDPTYTSQLCNGSKAAGKKIIEKILSTFPDVNRTWLYFGEGEMLSTSHQEKNDNKGQEKSQESAVVDTLRDIIREKDERISELTTTIARLQVEIESLKRSSCFNSSEPREYYGATMVAEN